MERQHRRGVSRGDLGGRAGAGRPEHPAAAQARTAGGLSRRVALAACLALLVVALVLRVAYAQRRTSVQIDEAQDFFLMSTAADLGELFERLENEGHPPLHYLVERAVVGLSAGADRGTIMGRLRALNVALATLTVALLMWFAWRSLGPGTAVLAGALAAASPFLVFHASMARMYALFGLLAVAHVAALARFLRRGTYRTAIVWGLTAALLAYTHYFSIYYIAAGGLYALLRKRTRADTLRVVAGGATCVVLFLPWLPSLRAQLDHDLQPWFEPLTGLSKAIYAARVPFGRWALPFLAYGLVRGALRTRELPGTAAPFWACVTTSLGGGLLGYFAQFAVGPLSERYVLPMVWSLLPAVAFGWAYLLEASEPIERHWRGRTWLRIPAPLGTVGVAVALVVTVVTLAYVANPRRWCSRGTSPSAEYAQLISREGRQDDLIWVQPSARCSDLLFHYEGELRVVAPPYGEGPLYTDWVESNLARSQPERAERYLAELERHLERGGRVWLVAPYPLDAEGLQRAREWGTAPQQRYDLVLLERVLERLDERSKPVRSVQAPVSEFHDPLNLTLFDPNTG